MSLQQENTDSGIRKAAILVASLDMAGADAILDQLGPEQAARVRRTVVDLGQVDPQEQRRVIDEFHRIGPMVPDRQPPGIELDDRLARKLAAQPNRVFSALTPSENPTARDRAAKTETGVATAKPFSFLRKAEADKLARTLDGERPQTIALVLSQIPSEQAGCVLAQFSAVLQAEVIQRLVELEETDPEILREVEQALQSRLSVHIGPRRRRVVGMKAVSDILKASGGGIGARILQNLAEYDGTLAERLGPRAIEFEELTELDDASLRAIFQAAEPELTFVALVGASPRLIERIARHLSPGEAAMLRHKLDHPGPIRLSDVEDARCRVAETARRLAAEGVVELPPNDFSRAEIATEGDLKTCPHGVQKSQRKTVNLVS